MKKIFSVLFLTALVAVAALAADVSGVWKASVPGREGAVVENTFTFKVDGEKLTGTITNPMGETAITDGKVAGDTITFKVKREMNGNAVVMVYEGKVAGSEIKFKTTREGSERPPREFTAKR